MTDQELDNIKKDLCNLVQNTNKPEMTEVGLWRSICPTLYRMIEIHAGYNPMVQKIEAQNHEIESLKSTINTLMEIIRTLKKD